jgi:hypothetical protein
LLGSGAYRRGIDRVRDEEPEFQQGSQEDMCVVLDKLRSNSTSICFRLKSEADQPESVLGVNGPPLGPADRRRGVYEDDPSHGRVLD